MKIVFLFALVAVAMAMPAAEPEADPQLLLSHPLTYSYPLVSPIKVETKTVPLTKTLPLVYSSGFPLSYHYGAYPYNYFPYLPLVAKPAEAAEPAVEEA